MLTISKTKKYHNDNYADNENLLYFLKPFQDSLLVFYKIGLKQPIYYTLIDFIMLINVSIIP